ncbi:MAG: hypothetical protein BIFFINMI_02381 [Phycisphaerae bacterium]|nr:hypothetical protein [Phycisphaerae bacterium]
MVKNAEKIAVSYIRFSSPQQATGDSLRRQAEWSKGWAKANGYRLAENLTFLDAGVSAFKGANKDTGQLKIILDLVKAGKIPSGSALLVERLDRLSREEIPEALELLLGLLRNGITVATAEGVFNRESVKEIGNIITAIAFIARGNNESKAKSDRVGAAWKRKKAEANKGPITAKGPAWLKLEGGAWKVLEGPAATVKRIFRLTVNGLGKRAIVKLLNREGVKPIGRAGSWHFSYVSKILSNKAVIGEYQPHTGRAGNRQPVGQPVEGYYPAIIEAKIFFAAQQAQQARRNARGRVSASCHNLFSGLLYTPDGASLTYVQKDKHQIVDSRAMRGEKGIPYLAFAYKPVETALLAITGELKPVEDDGGLSEALQALQGQQADISKRLAEVTAAIAAGRGLAALIPAAERLEDEQGKVEKEIADLQGKLASRQADTLTDTQALIEQLEQAKGEALLELREALRGAFRQLISRITANIYKPDPDDYWLRECDLTVKYRSGAVRSVRIMTRKNAVRYIGVSCLDPAGRIDQSSAMPLYRNPAFIDG